MGQEEKFEMMAMFMGDGVPVYTYAKTYHIGHFQYVQFI